MLKLLIADTGEDFSMALAERLKGTYRIRVCQEGREALDAFLSYKPDLAVLDMMLPGLDGITILTETTRCGLFPTVLAVTKLPTDYVVEAAARLQVSYMMKKPCDVKAVAERLKDLAARVKPPAATRPDPRTEVSNILLMLGISTKLRGYAYLREAILLMMEDPGQSITKVLYPAVGDRCDANKVQVERSIRGAINKAWAQRDDALWRLYFQNTQDRDMVRPTNAVFITAIADRLRTERELGQKL